MAGEHAILSPSAAYRWLVCTPSARFEEQIPDEESPYAEEGTLAHELAALLLSARAGLFKGPQKTFNGMLSSLEDRVNAYYQGQDKPTEFKEMYQHCEDYVSYVMDNGGKILIEHKYDVTKYIPLGYGTADATGIKPEVIHVTDFKYGAGQRVTATGNKQLMIYALGALLESKSNAETVVMHIYQPRAGGASNWELSRKDLLLWAENELGPKAKVAIAGMGDFVPGNHCLFCKARTSCKAYYDRFADVKAIKDKRVMTPADTATVLTYGPLVASWVKKIEAETLANLKNGKKVPGFKLVAGRSKRSFKNEDDVVDILLGENYDSDAIFDSSLKALTAIEKMVGPKKFKELFADQVVTLPGNPQLAPEDDVRPAVGASAADEYDDENDLT